MKHLALALILSLSLTGCLYEEGTITENRVQVKEDRIVQEVALADIDNGYVRGVAGHYRKHGDGPVDLTVTYDPHSKTNTAMHASNAASELVSAFKKQGLHDVNANIIPVQSSGEDSVVLLSYTSYTAHAPRGCEKQMAGLNDTDIGHQFDYKMGCSIETVLSKQIARPKDLLGQGQDSTSDGRRGSNIVERYRTGTPNESLDGETASGD